MSSAGWVYVGDSHSVWCIFYLQFFIIHGLCKIYCKPWCTLFSSFRNCFLAPGSEWTFITGGQDTVRNSKRPKFTLKGMLNSSRGAREIQHQHRGAGGAHRLSALLQPKRPINNSFSSLEVFTAARAGSQQLHYYSSCHRVLSHDELRPLALFSKLISEPYCGSAIHSESRRAERGAGESLFLCCCFWCGTWSEAISQCVQRAKAGKSRNLAWDVKKCTASNSNVWESFDVEMLYLNALWGAHFASSCID